jgi:hypothetical protein
MVRTASEILSVPVENIFVQGRPRAPRDLTVSEGGIAYEVRLEGRARSFDPALRILRQWIRDEAAGKRVLVSGPGAASFAVAAKKGRALSVTEAHDCGADLAVLELPNLDGQVPLLRSLARRMPPKSVVFLVSRAPRPKLDVEALSEWSATDVTAKGLPEEFRGRRQGKFPRIWRLVRQGEIGFGSAG